MSLQQIDLYLNDKLKENNNYIVFTFYELRVKLNLDREYCGKNADTLNRFNLLKENIEKVI